MGPKTFYIGQGLHEVTLIEFERTDLLNLGNYGTTYKPIESHSKLFMYRFLSDAFINCYENHTKIFYKSHKKWT